MEAFNANLICNDIYYREGGNTQAILDLNCFIKHPIFGERRIEIGNNCGFISTILSSRSLIKIGNYVKIGGNVRIFDHDYHSLNYLNRRDTKLDSSEVKSTPVIIENDLFKNKIK